MRRILVCGAFTLMLMVGAAVAQQAKAPPHVLVTAAELKWGEPPPVFEKGATSELKKRMRRATAGASLAHFLRVEVCRVRE